MIILFWSGNMSQYLSERPLCLFFVLWHSPQCTMLLFLLSVSSMVFWAFLLARLNIPSMVLQGRLPGKLFSDKPALVTCKWSILLFTFFLLALGTQEPLYYAPNKQPLTYSLETFLFLLKDNDLKITLAVAKYVSVLLTLDSK